LAEEAFPDLGAGRAGSPGIQTLNQQPEAFTHPDAAISRREQDRSLLAVNQSRKTEIHGQDGIPFSHLPSSNKFAPPAVEARHTGLSFLGQGTDTLRGNPEIPYQLGLGVKLLKPGQERKPSFRNLHSLQTMLRNEIRQSLA
jgi:hypothetical protein